MVGNVALRPLGVGDIVDRVFTIYRARPLLFLALGAIPYLVLVLAVAGLTPTLGASAVQALLDLLSGDIEGSSQRLASSLGNVLSYLGAVTLLALAASLIQSASLVEAASERYMGREATVGSSLRVGLAAAPRLLLMGLLALCGFILMWVVLLMAMALLREWWAILLGVVGGFAATFYLAASWMVSPAVAVLERTGPLTSLRRSWWLSNGNRWRILGIILLLVLLEVVLSSLLSVVLLASIAASEEIQVVIQQAVNLLATIAWAPVYWGTFAVLYYDLRVRKEALDLQLAAEALPREG